MTRLRATLALGLVLAAVLTLGGALVRVPFVALGDGPTFDVLGSVDGRTVVDVAGPVPTFPTSGQLRMTTVSVTSQVTLFGAMAMWISGDREVVPRESVYPTGQTRQQTEAENTRQFTQSETDASTAALRFLGYPGDVAVGSVTAAGPADGQLRPDDRILTVAGRPVGTPQDVVARAGRDPRGARRYRCGCCARGTRSTSSWWRGCGPATRPAVSSASSPSPGSTHRSGYGSVSSTWAARRPGLVFATAVVDKLTAGDLTGGRVVAGTGTIEADGTVGPIGGIRFKMDAARADGATLFLVPADNCREAASTAPEGLTLARVADLRDGVAALDAVRAGRAPAGC